MELKRYKLGEILELQRGYDLPSSQQKAGNVLVAGSNGIIGYHNEIRGNHPCITVGRSGSVGKVHYYEQPTWAHNTALFVKDFKGNNPQYLYYFLKNLHLDEMFVKGSSVVPSLDRKVVHSLVVPFHKEVVCQKRIALVLSNIDRKIELNRAINQNLEAMAKQLYDYWFVQFDFPNEEGKPYKSSGGEMVWNKELKREIPKEWTVAKLTDEMELQYGFPFSTDLFTEQITSVPVVRIRDILDNSISAYTTEDVEGRYLLQKQDLLIGMDGNFHINYWADNVSYLNQRTVRIRAKNNSNVSIVQAKYDIQPYIKAKEARAKGSTVGHLSDKDMKELYVLVCPNKKAREKFDALLSMIITNRNEVETLTKQRDELLPLLMNGQVSVNSDLAVSYIIYKDVNIRIMKENIIQAIVAKMQRDLDCRQMAQLKAVLTSELHNVEIIEKEECVYQQTQENEQFLNSFISAKKIEGCSDKTLAYYRNTIERLLVTLSMAICHITTSDIRTYLSNYQEEHQSSKVTIDNMRRIFSSFFAWLEDEDYIAKSPVRRIHKVKTDSLVKEVLSDEQLEQLRDSCTNKRDLAIIDFLSSTGIRVGELVKLNREDIDFHERQCVVFGKGNKERVVYFNARTKLHLQQYLNERTDDNPALFVSLNSPHSRLTISGVEVRIRKLGQSLSMPKVHPHKFRRTLATMAIDKGMPIEQVQRLLGHVRIDTTLHYAIVNQNNVKLAHKKYLG